MRIAIIMLTLAFIGWTVMLQARPEPAALNAVASTSAQSPAEWSNPRTLSREQISKNRRHAKEAAQYAAYAILSVNAYGPSHQQLPLPLDWSRVTFDSVGGRDWPCARRVREADQWCTGAAVRALVGLHRAPLGYDPRNLLVAFVSLPENSHKTWADRAEFYERLRDRLSHTPQVESAVLGVYTGLPPQRRALEVPSYALVSDHHENVRRAKVWLLRELKGEGRDEV